MKAINIKPVTLILMLVSWTCMHVSAQDGPFTLPALPYAYDALEPVIDAQTMEIHYSKHQAAYLKNLNAAVRGTDAAKASLDELVANAGKYGDAVRNNAGGVWNHTFFWDCLSLSHPFDPASESGKAVIDAFGSADSLGRLLVKTGASRFGSGWAWLIVTNDGKLAVCSTPNQDNPLMDISPQKGIPILGIDVWEHAYYLKYQNKRVDYLTAIVKIINWETVNRNYLNALKHTP